MSMLLPHWLSRLTTGAGGHSSARRGEIEQGSYREAYGRGRGRKAEASKTCQRSRGERRAEGEEEITWLRRQLASMGHLTGLKSALWRLGRERGVRRRPLGMTDLRPPSFLPALLRCSLRSRWRHCRHLCLGAFARRLQMGRGLCSTPRCCVLVTRPPFHRPGLGRRVWQRSQSPQQGCCCALAERGRPRPPRGSCNGHRRNDGVRGARAAQPNWLVGQKYTVSFRNFPRAAGRGRRLRRGPC